MREGLQSYTIKKLVHIYRSYSNILVCNIVQPYSLQKTVIRLWTIVLPKETDSIAYVVYDRLCLFEHSKKGTPMRFEWMLFLALNFFVCPAAIAKEMYGTFMIVKGDVTAEIDGKKSSVKVGSKIYAGNTVTTGAVARAKILMSDRNVIHVSPSTSMKIAEYVNTGDKKKVELELTQGKVRNQVLESYKGENKFIIKTPTAVAGVRGTDFFVNYSAKTRITEVVTLKGAVEFSALKNGVIEGNPVVVQQKQTSSSAPDKPIAAPTAVQPDDLKKMDQDSLAHSTPPTDKGVISPTAPSGKKESEGKRDRMGDTKDMAPKNFDQLPTSQKMPMTGTAPVSGLMPKQPDPRTTDAIRNKTDKTNVTIKPE
jgi:hypothetical protein